MRKMLNNKRGDVTVTILVIGIVAVCFFALITFYLAEKNTAQYFDSSKTIALINSDMEKYLTGPGTSTLLSEISGDAKGRYLHITLNPYSIILDVKYYLP